MASDRSAVRHDPLEVRLLYFEGCPNWEVARDRLRRALELQGLDQDVLCVVKVATPEEAEAVGFRGSPTILVDGRDPFGGDTPASGAFACRIYETPAGRDGAPSVGQLVAALRR